MERMFRSSVVPHLERLEVSRTPCLYLPAAYQSGGAVVQASNSAGLQQVEDL